MWNKQIVSWEWNIDKNYKSNLKSKFKFYLWQNINKFMFLHYVLEFQ